MEHQSGPIRRFMIANEWRIAAVCALILIGVIWGEIVVLAAIKQLEFRQARRDTFSCFMLQEHVRYGCDACGRLWVRYCDDDGYVADRDLEP